MAAKAYKLAIWWLINISWHFFTVCFEVLLTLAQTNYITRDRPCVMLRSCPHNVTHWKWNTFNLKLQYSESLEAQWHKVSLHCILLPIFYNTGIQWSYM